MSALARGLDEALRWLRRGWPLPVSVALIGYFAWHGLHGERGLWAWLEVGRELERAKSELVGLRTERRALEQRVEALQPDRSDPDLLEEQLRRLGYVAEREAVILAPAAAPR